MPILSINTVEAEIFADKLVKIGAKYLPKAALQALNKTALDVKKTTMPASAAKSFTIRQKTFFKANSKVEFAKPGKINSLKSRVGFLPINLKGNNYAVSDLSQQEYGGNIQHKSFIPIKSARVGGSSNKLVSARNRLASIKNIVHSNRRQSIRVAAKKAGVGGYVLRGNMLFRISAINKKIKATPLYSFKSGRSVKVGGTGFMRSASLASAEKMERFFVSSATEIINKSR